VYLRLYVTQSLLSYLVGLDQSNICRELNHRLLPLLQDVLPTPLRHAPLRAGHKEEEENPGQPARKQRRIRTLNELLCAYPELEEVLIDATEQEVPR